MASKDLYAILGVKDSASDDEIKKAYRELAKKFHPDRTGGDKAKETRFKDISAAYDVLSDPKKRAQYDAMKRGGFPGGNGGAGFPGGAGGPFPGGAGGMGNLEDLLAQMFGGGFGGAGGGRGGGSRRVIFEQDLGGGRGRRPHVQFFHDEPEPEPAPYVEQVLRTPAGDEFVRKGDDLFIDVPIAVDEAVLGAKVAVPTLDGRVNVTIPAGTSSGKKLRLKGKGWQGQGDLYAVVQIVVPPPDAVDAKAKAALEDFAKRAPVKPRKH